MVALLKSWFGYSEEKVEAAAPEKPPVYRVGEFYADYTPLTEAEINQANDPLVDELFRRSKPISG
jgi:hypothetical protein